MIKILWFLFVITVTKTAWAQNRDLLHMQGGQEQVVERFVDAEDLPYIKEIKVKNFSGVKQGSTLKKKVCGNMLRPLYKHQREKEYHLQLTVMFERQIPGLSRMCAVPQTTNHHCRREKDYRDRAACILERQEKICNRRSGAARQKCLDKPIKCIKPAVMKIDVISDAYYDECSDQEVKAFTTMSYQLPGETITDKVSPGHTLVLVEKFSTGAQYKEGEPYDVEKDIFFYFTTLE